MDQIVDVPMAHVVEHMSVQNRTEEQHVDVPVLQVDTTEIGAEPNVECISSHKVEQVVDVPMFESFKKERRGSEADFQGPRACSPNGAYFCEDV